VRLWLPLEACGMLFLAIHLWVFCPPYSMLCQIFRIGILFIISGLALPFLGPFIHVKLHARSLACFACKQRGRNRNYIYLWLQLTLPMACFSCSAVRFKTTFRQLCCHTRHILLLSRVRATV
jgi:hypothetical protein